MTDPRGPAWRTPYSTGHTCGWPGCDEPVSGRLWACRDHWRRLPYEIRDRLMAETRSPNRWHDETRTALFPVVEAEALAWIDSRGNDD